MKHYLLGVDDTDFGESIGTGALARELCLCLQRRADARSLGVTRHQLLVDPRIPYTSHNSAACIELESPRDRDEIADLACELVTALLHVGADPAICVCDERASLAPLTELGLRAQREVVAKEDALAAADDAKVIARELGGTGLGIIGALAACGLRHSRDDGRFISLPGTRELCGIMTAEEILARAPIDAVVDDRDAAVAGDSAIDTQGWVRPDLAGGRVVLRVAPADAGAAYRVIKKKHLDKH